MDQKVELFRADLGGFSDRSALVEKIQALRSTLGPDVISLDVSVVDSYDKWHGKLPPGSPAVRVSCLVNMGHANYRSAHKEFSRMMKRVLPDAPVFFMYGKKDRMPDLT